MAMSAEFPDRRRTPRFSRTISVQVQSGRHDVLGGLTDDATGLNIGLGGVCFVSRFPYQVEEDLDMMIRIADWDPEAKRRNLYIAVSSIPYVARGRVVRCEELAGGEFEVGVRFTDIAEDDRKALQKYLVV
ncbi:MAG: PilZ domain-containing protein [Thermodesulfobacteriota bacterium]